MIVKEHTGSENLHTATLRRSKLRNSRIQRPVWLGWAAGSEGHTESGMTQWVQTEPLILFAERCFYPGNKVAAYRF